MYTPIATTVLWIQVLTNLYTQKKKTPKAHTQFSSKRRKLLNPSSFFTNSHLQNNFTTLLTAPLTVFWLDHREDEPAAQNLLGEGNVTSLASI